MTSKKASISSIHIVSLAFFLYCLVIRVQVAHYVSFSCGSQPTVPSFRLGANCSERLRHRPFETWNKLVRSTKMQFLLICKSTLSLVSRLGCGRELAGCARLCAGVDANRVRSIFHNTLLFNAQRAWKVPIKCDCRRWHGLSSTCIDVHHRFLSQIAPCSSPLETSSKCGCVTPAFNSARAPPHRVRTGSYLVCHMLPRGR
jgi:hypothetical protein